MSCFRFDPHSPHFPSHRYMNHENSKLCTDLPTSHNPSSTVSITMSSLAGPGEPSDGSLHICPLRLPRNARVSNIVDIQFSVASPESDTTTVLLVPLHLVDGSAGADSSRHHGNLNASSTLKNEPYQTAAYLRVRVQIPQVEFTRPVSGTEHCRMEGVPLDIIHVIVRLFERVNRRNSRSV